MKNIFYIIIVLAVTIAGCDPLDETYKELDATVPDPTAAQFFELTLTDDDYEYLDEEFGVGGFGNFESEDEAKEYIPKVLDNLYPHLGDGSGITVTYELYRGTAQQVFVYTDADTYEVTADDYQNVDPSVGEAGFFNNNFVASDYLAGILNNQITDATDGDIVDISYEFADVAYEDISGVSVFSEDFETETDFDQYTFLNVLGPQTWQWDGSYGTKMSGHADGNDVANEDWMVLPQINLAGHAEAILTIRQAINYIGSGEIGQDISVKISTDYTGGDVTAATWDNLEIENWPAGDSWSFVNSEVDLSAYEDKVISLAFVYKSTSDFAATWEVSNVDIEVGETIETTTYNKFYTYDASSSEWEVVGDEVVYLTPDDYDAMGAPGKYDNFSSSDAPENYIPQFLQQEFPYAQEGDEKIVIYKYFSESIQTRGDVYTYTNGKWEAYQSVVEKTLQLGNEDGVWVPDNTIRYTLTVEDYSAIAANENLGTEGARSNLASYGNFSTVNGWNDAFIYEAIGFVLKKNFPDSEVGQKYMVAYDTYPSGPQQVHLILGEDGEYTEVQ